jgi:hypothetical protein
MIPAAASGRSRRRSLRESLIISMLFSRAWATTAAACPACTLAGAFSLPSGTRSAPVARGPQPPTSATVIPAVN